MPFHGFQSIPLQDCSGVWSNLDQELEEKAVSIVIAFPIELAPTNTNTSPLVPMLAPTSFTHGKIREG